MTNDTVEATLKRHGKLLAVIHQYVTDSEYRKVAVPNVRNRWSRVMKAINGRSWIRLELHDKAGAVLDDIVNTEEATDPVDLPVTRGMEQYALAVKVTELVQIAVDHALEASGRRFERLLDAHAGTLTSMTTAMRATVDMYREQVDAAQESADMRSEAEAAAAVAEASKDGGFSMKDFKELMEAAPALIGLLPMLKKMLMGSDAPNGHV